MTKKKPIEDLTKKPNGYWKKEENVLAEARQAMKEQEWGTLPSATILKKHGYHSLNTAINQYHGRIQNIRTTLGQNNIRKPHGYWQNLDNALAEARKVMEEHGLSNLPTHAQLRKYKYNSLSITINKYHGGLNKFLIALGQQPFGRKPKNYWKSLDNTLAEVQRAMQEQQWNTLPSDKQLRKHGYHSLIHAIRHHGGMQNFRTTLGQKNPKKTSGYWQSLENTIGEALKAMQEQGWNTLPASHEIQKHGYASLNAAINNYHGGIQNIRIKLGQQNYKKPPGYWQKEENVIAEAKKAMGEQEWNTLPSSTKLAKHGYSDLSSGIYRYHGGFHKFRKLLAECETGKTRKEQLEELLDVYIAA